MTHGEALKLKEFMAPRGVSVPMWGFKGMSNWHVWIWNEDKYYSDLKVVLEKLAVYHPSEVAEFIITKQ